MSHLDPTSIDYPRCYNKPKINILRFFFFVVGYILLLIIEFYILDLIHLHTIMINIIFLLSSLFYFFLQLKYIVVLIIQIYQNLAPISLRSQCRFEPSCSNYMLMAIDKYGLFLGLKKGIIRLKRCNITDGGFDYP